MIQDDPTYTDIGHGFINQLAIQVDPRFGLAWDPKGDGKMVIRVGAGAFHDGEGGPYNQGGPAFEFTQNIRYTDMNSYFVGVGPTSITNVSGYWRLGQKRPLTYNYNIGIQKDIGFHTILDVAYVGSNTHHNQQSWDFNTLRAGQRFLPESRDLTVSAGACPTGRELTCANPGALPDAFLRPIAGFGSITMGGPATTERYDSLQVNANRRFARGLQLSAAYTWAGGTANGWNQNNPLPSIVARSRNTLVQKQVAVLTYTWDVPKGSKLIHGAVASQVLDFWQIQGVTAFANGQISNVSAGTTDNFDFTGGGESCGTFVQTGNAVLPRDQRTVDRWFNTDVFQRPVGRGDIGNNCNNAKFLQPGFNNHDISVFKKFPLKSEKRTLEFRAESFNAFNHTQFQTIGTTAQFDTAGRQTNTTFGKVTAARDGRKMVFGLKFSF